MEQWEHALTLLEQGEYQTAIAHFISLYQNGFEPDRVLQLLDEIFIRPNSEELESIYEKNRQVLAEEYPQFYLPELTYLKYSLLPIEEGVYALFDTNTHQFTLEDFSAEQYFYLQLFTEESLSITDEWVCILKQESAYYEEEADRLGKLLDDYLSSAVELAPDILDQISLYQKLKPYDDMDQYYLAYYYYRIQQYQKAETHAKRALAYNRRNVKKLLLLSSIYLEQDNLIEGGRILAYLYYNRLPGSDIAKIEQKMLSCIELAFHTSRYLFQEMLSYVMDTVYYPRYRKFDIKNGKLEIAVRVMIAQFLPKFSLTQREWQDFVGVFPTSYVEVEFIHHMNLNEMDVPNHYLFIKTMIQKSQIKSRYQVDCKNCPTVLPIAGTDIGQRIKIADSAHSMEIELYPAMFKYFRLPENAQISSSIPFILGKPIPLKQSPKRKKLVLSLFLDAASFSYIKETDFALCPNIKAFFQKGIIFGQNYSVGEFTVPVYPSLHTGLYPNRHQFFNGEPNFLSETVETIEEKFQKEGYYCAAISAESNQPFTDSIRGFDKVVCQGSYSYAIQDIVRDVIEHLSAFSETDNFVWAAALDPHRVIDDIADVPCAQTTRSFEEVYNVVFDKTKTSVFQEKNPTKIIDYNEILSAIDMQLGLLFEYITSHYKEEDYVVSLTSDHGVPILDEETWLLKEHQTSSLFLLRGANIPNLGLVENEMTSSLDLFPALCHAASISYQEDGIDGRLPKALSGPGREYTITESSYAGQTYKMDIRDLNYEFRFETEAFTDHEYRVDLSVYTVTLINRKSGELVDDPALLKKYTNIVMNHLKHRRARKSV